MSRKAFAAMRTSAELAGETPARNPRNAVAGTLKQLDPATVALVPTVVRDAQLERANSRIASAEILTNDVGGGPVGSTLFGFTPWLPFVVDAASYLGSVVPFRGLPRDPGRSDASSGSLRSSAISVVAEAREGFGWLRRHPVLGPLTVAQVVYFFVDSPRGFFQLINTRGCF